MNVLPSRSTLLTALVCLGLAFSPILAAQSAPAAKPAAAAADYSNQPYLYESIISKVVFQDDGTSTRDTVARARVQTQAGVQQFGILNIPYASGTSTLEIVALHVLKPDKRVVETPAENQIEMPLDITRQAPDRKSVV